MPKKTRLANPVSSIKCNPLLEAVEFRQLNDEQKQALDWTRSIAVRANAGSGKTTVLVQRIIQILNAHRDLTLDRIVAITFTRKAGSQLRQKLHEALSARIADSDGDDRNFWQERLDEVVRCPIGTIDSLCHRLLHRGIEAGLVHDLDPAFGILDGIDYSEVMELAIRRTEIELHEPTVPGHSAWERWLRTQGRGELTHALRTLLAHSIDVTAFANDWNCSEVVVADLLDLPALRGPLEDMAKRRSNLASELQNALDQIRQSSRRSEKVKAIIAFLEETSQNLDRRTDFELIGALKANLFTQDGKIWKPGLETNGSAYFPRLNEIQKFWARWMPDWTFELSSLDGFEQVRDLCTIAAIAHRHFYALCCQENKFDFGVLAERVNQLLDNPDHAKQLTQDYRFILVDEFQDTNQIQWQIVARLAGVDPARPVTSDKLMIVGDPQQSIYRFRKADPTVFDRIITLIQDGNRDTNRVSLPTACDGYQGIARSSDDQRSGLMRLRKNYRSHDPLPLQLINKMSVHALNQVGADPQPLEAGLTEADPNAEVVYLFPASTEDEDSATDEPEGPPDSETKTETLDDKQLELVAVELHHQHQKGFRWGKMAILLRSRTTHFLNLEVVLRKYHIPYQLVGGLGFWQRQEIRDLVCLANCLANGADELALFAVLRGPLCGLDDSELFFLSMLGGRRLLTGLQRIMSAIQGEDDVWLRLKPDETEIFRTAFEGISAERRAVLKLAGERLGHDGFWRQRVDRMPHAELLRLAVDEAGAWAVYTDGDEGERQLANLRMFFDELRQLELGRPATLAETARRLKKLVDESTKDEQAELTPIEGDAVQVMTVHAAKGLEFEVVALVGLERRFRTDSEPILLLDRFQHIRPEKREDDLAKRLHGLPVIRFRNPENPLERVCPLLHQAIGKMEGQRNNEEEARIFHVAITRAEKVLIVAGKAPKGKSWPPKPSWQNWLHEALSIANEIEGGTHQINGLPLRVVRNVAPIKQADSSENPATVPMLDLDPISESPRRHTVAATVLFEMLKLFDESREQWEMRYRHHVAPRVGSIPKHLIAGVKKEVGKDIGKLVGTLVHRALEMGDSFPTNIADCHALLLAHATMLLRESGFDPDEPGTVERQSAGAFPESVANTAWAILRDVLPNNPFRSLLDAAGESEVDFALPIGDWVITGRFDRLIQPNGSWEIVDWKTDADPPDAIMNKYANQMQTYALALSESLPQTDRPGEIIVHLAMTSARESRKRKFAANDLKAFHNELETRLRKLSTAF